MIGDNYTIVKGYKVYKGHDRVGEPMAEFNEPQLYAWLLNTGGYSTKEAAQIIMRIDVVGEIFIVFP